MKAESLRAKFTYDRFLICVAHKRILFCKAVLRLIDTPYYKAVPQVKAHKKPLKNEIKRLEKTLRKYRIQ